MSLKIKTLVEWALNNGSTINEGISFEDVQSKGCSAILKQDIKDKTDLIKIPGSLLITPDLAIDYFGKEFTNEKTGNEQLQLFVAKLKFDSNDTSSSTTVESLDYSLKFKPYIDSLPSSDQLSGVPFYWHPAEIELLKGTDARMVMNNKFTAIVQEWKDSISQLDSNKQIKEDLKFYDDYVKGSYKIGDLKLYEFLDSKIESWTSFTAYLWSYCIFSSRAFPLILIKGSKVKYTSQAFLLPIVDLLNHENGRKVSWKFENNEFLFSSLDSDTNLKKGLELYNNYGDKTNLDLLFGYGFTIDNNEFDSTSVTVKVDEETMEAAKVAGFLDPSANVKGINFDITRSNILPSELVKFFAYLVQLTSEKGQYTLRMKLESLTQIKQILESKVAFFKNSKIESSKNLSEDVIKTVKKYKNSQKSLFQRSVDEVNKIEKQLLKEYKPLSFKTVLKNDKTFTNSLILTFGAGSYEELSQKGLLNQCLLLWIIRNYNKSHYNAVDDSIFPDFIYNTFQDVRNTIQITKEDVLEYQGLYTTLFPKLAQKIPEIYAKGDWSAKNMIIAGTVVDRIGFTRTVSNEMYLLNKIVLETV
ncbi:hypothetical protein CANARDRAFT_29068 [[Candida] arabinofermentans NRRL YB-2248]|uniref:SET domain-containing protein n=1 Tax=[Candida] arabinofermentans NRRL YB-2248 TaxID=983967 RepID=A0A1E4SYG9_9ASCO|nr:hypothetical protein CANARDRAFT_29068 [[Candida] arabinofermentans NRRL YB-2248]